MPSPTTWTRLEPRFRDRELRDSLTATLHDPLWLLGRQWQLGEFDGEDGGTPVHTALTVSRRPLTQYRLGTDGPVEPYHVGGTDPSPPLETLVERERVRPTASDADGDAPRNRRLAAEAGEQFRRYLAAAGLSYPAEAFEAADLSAFPTVESLLLNPDDDGDGDAASYRYLRVVRGRVLDGDAVYRVVDRSLPVDLEGDDETGDGSESGSAPPLPQPDPAPSDADAYREAARQYRDWYADLYTEPDTATDDDGAWRADRLEHEFAVAAGTADDQVVLGAEEYRGGRLDWYSFDARPDERLSTPIDALFDPRFDLDFDEIRRWFDAFEDVPSVTDGGDPSGDGDGDPPSEVGGGETDSDDGAVSSDSSPEEVTLDVTPTAVRYRGMPAPRWWELEDTQVNLDDVDAAPEDLSRLLLLEFALLYGNDWFEIPADLPIGTLATVGDLTITDTFGRETTVEHTSRAGTPADSGADTGGETTADPSGTDGWRMFDFDVDGDGDSDRGLFLPPVLADVLETEPVEAVQFVRDEMVNVAWALEERVEGPIGTPLDRHELDQETDRERHGDNFALPEASIADVSYRLATAVPDYWLPLLPVQDVAGQVSLHLGDLIDGSGTMNESWGRILGDDLAIPEAEVPRSGTAVRRSYQLARWTDGSTYLWSGRRTDPGRGEGSSGLRFDIVEDRTGHSQGAGRVGDNGSPLAVVSLQSRPPGRGPDRLNAEYLVLENVSGRSLSVTDWTVADTAGHSYTFDESTLAPGEAVVLRTGSGVDSERVRHWGASRPIWNDVADEVRITDEDGDEVLVQSYPDISDVAADSPIEIAELHVDAAGDDYETLTDEYVVLENTTAASAEGDGSVDLAGWVVRDIADHRYVFPDDGLSVLGPGNRLTLRTGRGIDEPGTRYWGATRPVWNNTDDAVLVFSSEGRLMAGRVY